MRIKSKGEEELTKSTIDPDWEFPLYVKDFLIRFFNVSFAFLPPPPEFAYVFSKFDWIYWYFLCWSDSFETWLLILNFCSLESDFETDSACSKVQFSSFFRFLPYVYLFLLIFNLTDVGTVDESMLLFVVSWLMVFDWL